MLCCNLELEAYHLKIGSITAPGAAAVSDWHVPPKPGQLSLVVAPWL